MAKARSKAPAVAIVPQNRDEAARQLLKIGELGRELSRRAADMNDALARIKEQVVASAAPLEDEKKRLEGGLQIWCEANRTALTGNGRVKFADLGTGIVKWQARAASVKGVPKDPSGLIERIKALGFLHFIRTKEEVDKEAMRADPETARKVAGISIGSDGEDFIVEPFETKLVEAA